MGWGRLPVLYPGGRGGGVRHGDPGGTRWPWDGAGLAFSLSWPSALLWSQRQCSWAQSDVDTGRARCGQERGLRRPTGQIRASELSGWDGIGAGSAPRWSE